MRTAAVSRILYPLLGDGHLSDAAKTRDSNAAGNDIIPYLALLRKGLARQRNFHSAPVVSYTAISPLPNCFGGMLSVALSFPALFVQISSVRRTSRPVESGLSSPETCSEAAVRCGPRYNIHSFAENTRTKRKKNLQE